MDVWKQVIIDFLVVSYVYSSVYAFLNLDELRSVQYGIDILREPVVRKPEVENGDNCIHLTSKYGQDYQCYIPSPLEQDKKKEEAEKEAMETGILDLLKPMETLPCLTKTKDWWSYEFCYGKYVRQYHIEDGRVASNIVILGNYDSEFDWNNKNKEELEKTRLHRYHTQQYVNGLKCDLTGEPRTTEVRFICEEGSGDYIHRIDEPETCKYILTIHTTRICHHPYLKPPVAHKAVPITCNPLLTVKQYQEYLNQIEVAEMKKKKAEEIKKAKEDEKKKQTEERRLRVLEKAKRLQEEIEEKIRQNEGTWKSADKTSEEGQATKTNLLDKEPDQVEDEKTSAEKKEPMQKPLGEDTDIDLKMVMKIIKNPDDLEGFVEEAMKEMTKVTSSVADSSKSLDLTEETLADKEESKNKETLVSDPVDKEVVESDEDGVVEEEEDVLQQFDTELEKMKAKYQKYQKRLPPLASKVKQAMEDEFENIIKEAEEDLEAEGLLGSPKGKKQALQHLTNTLNSLIDKLEKTEQEINDVDRELEEFVSQVDGIDSSASSDVLGSFRDGEDGKDAGKKGEAKNSLEAKGPAKTNQNSRLRVRVTKLNPGDPKIGSAGGSKETEKLQEKVAEGLKEAGIDAGNVQVKIITAGYYDEKDEKIHILSDEDSEAFKNIIVSIIGESAEADKEEQRHIQMQDNYKFVWGTEQQQQQQIDTSEDVEDDSTTAAEITK